jgi:hypothetical protein
VKKEAEIQCEERVIRGSQERGKGAWSGGFWRARGHPELVEGRGGGLGGKVAAIGAYLSQRR